MSLVSKNRVVRLVLPLVTAVAILLILQYNEKEKETSTQAVFEERFGPVMGTTGYVKIVPTSTMHSTAQDAFNIAYKATKDAESLLSRYIESSDISKINSAKAGVKTKVDPLTWQILLEARRFYMLSNHAFDPSLGTLIDIYPWGEKEISALPDKDIISNALANSGLDKIEFIREGMYIRKTNPDVILDLGGIAKGLGVSIMASSLEKQGIESAVIEIGGEITLIGSPDIEQKSKQIIGSEEKVWTTGIKNPRGQGLIDKFTAEGGVSVATSGDYEKFFLVGDKRYSHIIDPRTGYPTEGGIISATISTKRTCTVADALATSVTVLGVDKARELLKLFPDTTAYLVLNDMSEIIIKGGIEERNDNVVTEGMND